MALFDLPKELFHNHIFPHSSLDELGALLDVCQISRQYVEEYVVDQKLEGSIWRYNKRLFMEFYLSHQKEFKQHSYQDTARSNSFDCGYGGYGGRSQRIDWTKNSLLTKGCSLDVVKFIFGENTFRGFDTDIILSAVRGCSWAVIEWLRRAGFPEPKGQTMIKVTATGERFDTMKRLIEEGHSFQLEDIYYHVFKTKDLELFAWMWLQIDDWTNKFGETFIEFKERKGRYYNWYDSPLSFVSSYDGGSVHCYLRGNYRECAMSIAAFIDAFPILQFLADQGLEPDYLTLAYAARHDSWEICEWIMDRGVYPQTDEEKTVLGQCVDYHSYERTKWFVDQDECPREALVHSAMMNDEIEILDELLSNDSPYNVAYLRSIYGYCLQGISLIKLAVFRHMADIKPDIRQMMDEEEMKYWYVMNRD